MAAGFGVVVTLIMMLLAGAPMLGMPAAIGAGAWLMMVRGEEPPHAVALPPAGMAPRPPARPVAPVPVK